MSLSDYFTHGSESYAKRKKKSCKSQWKRRHQENSKFQRKKDKYTNQFTRMSGVAQVQDSVPEMREVHTRFHP